MTDCHIPVFGLFAKFSSGQELAKDPIHTGRLRSAVTNVDKTHSIIVTAIIVITATACQDDDLKYMICPLHSEKFILQLGNK